MGCANSAGDLQVFGHSKHSCDRAVQEVRVLPSHECLHKEVIEDPSIFEKVSAAEWPPSFQSHPVIQKTPVGSMVPLAFYMDAAQYTKSGAVVVVFVLCKLVIKDLLGSGLLYFRFLICELARHVALLM